MLDLARGLIAGFVATVVISMIMILRLAMGLMPWFNPVEIMNLNVQTLLDTRSSPVLGWFVHFVVGTVLWGGIYAVLADRLPGQRPGTRGLVFGLGAWLFVMLTVFPLAGSGFFALGLGVAAMLFTLITHLVFGWVLGATFGWLRGL